MFTAIERIPGARYYANTGWLSRGSTVHPDSEPYRGHLIAMDIDSGDRSNALYVFALPPDRQ